MIKPTAHHPNFLKVIYILKPLLRQYPALSVMKTDDLCDWISWYWNRATMTYVIDGDEPLGVCLIRLFRRLDQFLDRDAYDPCGKFCYIECAIARDGEIMRQMLETLESRWGPQEIMLWDRQERTENGAPRMFTWNQFKKLARRLSQWDHHLSLK